MWIKQAIVVFSTCFSSCIWSVNTFFTLVVRPLSCTRLSLMVRDITKILWSGWDYSTIVFITRWMIQVFCKQNLTSSSSHYSSKLFLSSDESLLQPFFSSKIFHTKTLLTLFASSLLSVSIDRFLEEASTLLLESAEVSELDLGQGEQFLLLRKSVRVVGTEIHTVEFC